MSCSCFNGKARRALPPRVVGRRAAVSDRKGLTGTSGLTYMSIDGANERAEVGDWSHGKVRIRLDGERQKMTSEADFRRLTRRGFTLGAAAVTMAPAGLQSAHAQSTETLRVGVLGDFSGPYSAISGEGSAVAARLAIADFGGKVLGRPVELVTADHQNKADVGLAIVREWFGPGRVSMITDVTNSAIALGIQPLLTECHRIALYTTVGNSDLIGKACSPLERGVGARHLVEHGRADPGAAGTGHRHVLPDRGRLRVRQDARDRRDRRDQRRRRQGARHRAPPDQHRRFLLLPADRHRPPAPKR